MGTAQPNWADLEQRGRLPKHMAHMVPGAKERMALKGRLKIALAFLTDSQIAEYEEKIKELED